MKAQDKRSEDLKISKKVSKAISVGSKKRHVKSSTSSQTFSKQGNDEDLILDVKFLDNEENLLNEHQESADEERFNFMWNTKFHIKNAFSTVKPEKNKWEQKLLELLIKYEVIDNRTEFDKYVSSKEFKVRGFFKYSLNPAEDFGQTMSLSTSYLPKFMILVSLLFEISFLYQFTFVSGFAQYVMTIYNFMVLNFSQKSLLNIGESSYQVIYFSFVLFWLIFVFIFILLCKRYEVERKTENYIVIYRMKRKEEIKNNEDDSNKNEEETYEVTQLEKWLFNSVLFIVIYFYVPILRDSMFSIFFIVKNYDKNSTKTESVFSTDSINIAKLCVFIIGCLMLFTCIFLPFYFYKLINSSFPLLEPFDSINDTNFHSIECPSTCSGASLDIDKRMCWDFIKDDMFIVDISRPISMFNFQKKEKRVLKKYYYSCNSDASPLLILFQGVSFYFRYLVLWSFIKYYAYLIVMNIPFSNYFKNFDDTQRMLISYSFGIFFCFFLFIENVINFKRKYNYLSDSILELIVRFFILIISLMSLLKVAIGGNYLQNVKYQSLFDSLEYVSFSCLCVCIVVLIIFIIISLPGIRSKFGKKYFKINHKIFHASSEEIKTNLLQKMWMPFWDNLFKKDYNILSKNIRLNDEFIKEYLIDNDVTENLKKNIMMSPINRMKQLRKIRMKRDNDSNYLSESEKFEKISKSDILLRKWLQNKLEGVDVFWDGDVIGKRTCLNYFGRLIINEHPFKVFIIYDESNEKVEIPPHEWISLSRSNVKNQETLRQKNIRLKIKSLNGVKCTYDEFFYERKKETIPINKKNVTKAKSINDKNLKIKENENKDNSAENGNNGQNSLKVIEIEKINNSLEADKTKRENILKIIENENKDINLEAEKIKGQNTLKINENEKKVIIGDGFLKGLKSMKDMSGKLFSFLGDKSLETKTGILKIQTIMGDKKICHGLNITMEVDDPENPGNIKEIIKFDEKEIGINSRNFRFTKLNILLQLNENLINEESIKNNENEKQEFRDYTNFKRYLDEITLSSHFYDMVYDNFDVTIMEIFKYFVYFEKRKEMKILPYFHINGLIFVSHLWTLCSDNDVQSFWYCFFYDIWVLNKSMIDNLGLGKFFDPDSSMSICYYFMERQKLENLLNKLEISTFFPKETLNTLYKKIKELKEEISEEYKEKLKNLEKMNLKLNNVPKKFRNVDEDYLNTEEINKIINRSHNFRNKASQELHNYHPTQYVTPTWIYLCIKDDNELKRINENVFKDLKKKIKTFFHKKSKNTEILFDELGEKYSLLLGLYSDDQIFDIYFNREFLVKESILAELTKDIEIKKTDDFKNTEDVQINEDVQNTFNEIKEKKNRRNAVNEDKIVSARIGNYFNGKNIELELPSIFKYIDFYQQFEEKIEKITKIDSQGRIFYVDKIKKLTTFMHPILKQKKIKNPFFFNDEEEKKEYFIFFYKIPETGEERLVYANKITKVVSWIPEKRK